MTGTPPPPGEWHPAYVGNAFVTAWLADRAHIAHARWCAGNQRAAYLAMSSAPTPAVITVALPVKVRWSGPDGPMVCPPMPVRTLHCHTAIARAVSTDKEYWRRCWMWVVGIDDLGRSVSSMAWPVSWHHGTE